MVSDDGPWRTERFSFEWVFLGFGDSVTQPALPSLPLRGEMVMDCEPERREGLGEPETARPEGQRNSAF